MSLFGKILGVLNILGAIAVLVLAFTAYGKRQAWAYAVLRHQILLDGLPVDDKEKDTVGNPLVDKLSEKTLRDLFAGVGGQEQRTQVEEVIRVQQSLGGRIKQYENSPREQTFLLARILLPLAESYLEREELLPIRAYYGTDKGLADFKDRYAKAFADAAAVPDAAAGKTPRSFEESFRMNLRTQGGEPTEVFTSLVLAQFPNLNRDEVRKVRFDDTWNAALKKQNEDLQARLNERFSRALLSIPTTTQPPGQGENTQKRNIARLLFAMAPVMAEVAADFKNPDLGTVDYGASLIGSPEYATAMKRVYVVCGIRAALAAIGDEADVMGQLAQDASKLQDQDLTTFVLDHGVIVEDLRERAALIQVELDRIADNTKKRDAQRTLVAQRKRDVEQLRTELTGLRGKTDDAIKDLRGLSEQVLQIRVKLRDGIDLAQQHERTIRNLETLIRNRERESGKK